MLNSKRFEFLFLRQLKFQSQYTRYKNIKKAFHFNFDININCYNDLTKGNLGNPNNIKYDAQSRLGNLLRWSLVIGFLLEIYVIVGFM